MNRPAAQFTVRFSRLKNGRVRFLRQVFRNDETTALDERELDLTAPLPAHLRPPPHDRLGDLDEAGLRDIGRRLCEDALGENGLRAVLEAARTGEAVIRIEETLDAPSLCAVPWELMHDGEGFLACRHRHSVERVVADCPPSQVSAVAACPRLLSFWAAPEDQLRLQVEQEQIAFARAISPWKIAGRVEDFEYGHCTRPILEDVLSDAEADILYFTGHGDFDGRSGGIALESEQRELDLVEAMSSPECSMAWSVRPP